MIEFLTSRHLATLTTLRRNGSPHVVPVGFTYDPQDRAGAGDHQRRVGQGTQRRPDPGALPAAICQVDGARWLTRQRAGAGGHAIPTRSPMPCARYAGRYRQPRVNPLRVALIIEVDRMLGSSRLG